MVDKSSLNDTKWQLFHLECLLRSWTRMINVFTNRSFNYQELLLLSDLTENMRDNLKLISSEIDFILFKIQIEEQKILFRKFEL